MVIERVDRRRAHGGESDDKGGIVGTDANFGILGYYPFDPRHCGEALDDDIGSVASWR
jgi:hypothetical protein